MNDFDFQSLANLGVAGVMLVWFMFRLERILTRSDRTVNLMARALIRLLERHDATAANDLSNELQQVNGKHTDD